MARTSIPISSGVGFGTMWKVMVVFVAAFMMISADGESLLLIDQQELYRRCGTVLIFSTVTSSATIETGPSSIPIITRDSAPETMVTDTVS